MDEQAEHHQYHRACHQATQLKKILLLNDIRADAITGAHHFGS